MILKDIWDENMYNYIFDPEEKEKLDRVIKEFNTFKNSNRPNFYFDFFRIYLKDKDGIELEYSENNYDFQIFPRVLKMRTLRIPTGDIYSFEGACRCCFGIAYHILGYSNYNIESESSCYIDKILEKSDINIVARAYLLGLSENGYFEKMQCISINIVNNIL